MNAKIKLDCPLTTAATAPVRVCAVQIGGGYRLPAPVNTGIIRFGGGYRLPGVRAGR